MAASRHSSTRNSNRWPLCKQIQDALANHVRNLRTFEVGDGGGQEALQDAELEGVAAAVVAAGAATPRDVGPKSVRQLDRVSLPPAVKTSNQVTANTSAQRCRAQYSFRARVPASLCPPVACNGSCDCI